MHWQQQAMAFLISTHQSWDNKTPGNMTDEHPMTNAIKSQATIFTKAIDKLIKANTTSSKPKLWEPNPFNGSDQKLQNFILQFKLNFRDQKDLF